MKIGIAQINSTVGDISGNAALILSAYQELIAQGAELVITPELALTGYPPQDLLFENNFVDANLVALENLEKKITAIPLLVGFVDKNKHAHGNSFLNAAAVLRKGNARVTAYKRLLPTYDVFDEARYFEPGQEAICFSYHGKKIGITICEDLWSHYYLPRKFYSIDPAQELLDKGAELILNLSASPFALGKPLQRLAMLQAQSDRLHVPIVYCNAVGGNDQLIFDGHSLVITPQKKSHFALASCREEKKVVDLTLLANQTTATPALAQAEENFEQLYDALLLGIRDYVHKCGFKQALLGLSGGIDSALVATLATAALGAKRVTGVLMPSPYSSAGSIEDALALATHLEMPHLTLPITPLYQEAKHTLKKPFANFPENSAEENLQARLRGMLLMALSNKFGSLLLTTGNKSELAVGYCTLYGDMCGGLAVIADLPKTVVYQLAHWINREREIIPWNSINKAPSAELRDNQKDQDSLPPYEMLDAILELLLEKNQSISEIIAHGFEEKIVHWIARHVYRNEYKRQQAAPVLKVTSKAFGLGRRFPIAQRYC